MKAAQNVAVVLLLIIAARLFLNPSSEHLVPRVEGGKFAGYTLRSTKWWGLSYNEYPATMSADGAFYTNKAGQREIVPREAYDEQ